MDAVANRDCALNQDGAQACLVWHAARLLTWASGRRGQQRLRAQAGRGSGGPPELRLPPCLISATNSSPLLLALFRRRFRRHTGRASQGIGESLRLRGLRFRGTLGKRLNPAAACSVVSGPVTSIMGRPTVQNRANDGQESSNGSNFIRGGLPKPTFSAGGIRWLVSMYSCVLGL